MKTVVVISDSHGNREGIDKIGETLRAVDCVFHLGDVFSDAVYIKNIYNQNVISILGNCDVSADDERVIEIENVKFLLTHGHKYAVKAGTERLLERANELGVSCALFGHTHNAMNEKVFGITLFNPGAMSKYVNEMSYGYLAVIDDKALFKVVSVR